MADPPPPAPSHKIAHKDCPPPQKSSTNNFKLFVVSVKPVRILAERLCLFKHGHGRVCSSVRFCSTIFRVLSRQVFCMKQVCNHLVNLSAKFGALNQRINEIRSSENLWWPLPQVLTLRSVKPHILWLCDLPAMLSRASWTIMDNSLDAYSPFHASCLG